MAKLIAVEPELVWIGVSALNMGNKPDDEAAVVGKSILINRPGTPEDVVLAATKRALVFNGLMRHPVVMEWLIDKRLCLPVGSMASTHPSCIETISKMDLEDTFTGTVVATKFIKEMSKVLEQIPEDELAPEEIDDVHGVLDEQHGAHEPMPHMSGDFHDFVRARVGQHMDKLVDNLDMQCDSCVRGFYCESIDALGIEVGRMIAYGAISDVTPAMNTRSLFEGILKGMAEFRDEHSCPNRTCQDQIVEVEKVLGEMLAIMQSAPRRRRVSEAN